MLAHRFTFRGEGDRRELAIAFDREGLAQGDQQRLELIGERPGIEAEGGGGRIGQPQLRVPEAAQGVLALAPQELGPGRGAALDGDDLTAALGAEEPSEDRADPDQLAA